MGVRKDKLRVNIDRKKIESFGLDAQQILNPSKVPILIFQLVSVKDQMNETTIRIAGKFKNTKDIEDVVISNRDGRAIYLKDVATVIDGIKELKPSAVIMLPPRSAC
jgi:HAE1 family hydrophobic/amphiphilic exporter-1